MNPRTAVFDYSASAELFPGNRSKRFRTLRYHRFDSTAEALRYVIEQLPPEMLAGAVLETEAERIESDQMTALYESDAYPLPRTQAAPN